MFSHTYFAYIYYRIVCMLNLSTYFNLNSMYNMEDWIHMYFIVYWGLVEISYDRPPWEISDICRIYGIKSIRPFWDDCDSNARRWKWFCIRMAEDSQPVMYCSYKQRLGCHEGLALDYPKIISCISNPTEVEDLNNPWKNMPLHYIQIDKIFVLDT